MTTTRATLAELCRAALFALGRELAAWRASSARTAFAAEAVLSVALSVALANALGLSDTWWAAISGFAVMQTSFAGSVQRAAHRIIGTVAGAALGALAGPWLGDRPWLFVPALGVIGGVAVYRANGSKSAYAWILGGVTALMVTYEAHKFASFRATALFAGLRVAEVAVGTLACVLVASAFHFVPKWWRFNRALSADATAHATSVLSESGASVASGASTTSAASGKSGASGPSGPSGASDISNPAALTPPLEFVRSTRMLLGLQAALSITLLAALTYVLHLPGFAQAMVTTVAVLIVPLGPNADSTRQPVMEKMVQRVAGCLLAGVLAVALLPLMLGQALLCMLALAMGVWVGCHVQTGREGASYVGRQFTIAFIMVFVQDHHWSSDPLPALMRLSGIFMGIVVLAGVMFATSRLSLPSMSRNAGR
ncbi:putative membrane protein YccC [Paraburkholderia sp. GAS41]|jgi:uncharacterized membrane protein YccC|uniref:FUSC family protein n=1 Tax=Paraburkholderia sp. GAS41 TaxID=3035134 RepID=UPI003D25E93D